jgi:SAM-dependent methyltransferase
MTLRHAFRTYVRPPIRRWQKGVGRQLGLRSAEKFFAGRCPVCEADTGFASRDDWFRDHLRCETCDSIPRERAFARVLMQQIPNWRDLVVHESSPVNRSISALMRRECAGYIGSQYWPDLPPGTLRDGSRAENLEALSFADASIDLHCHLDVLEHVNDPEACFREMTRTLRPGGHMLFTTPIYAGKPQTERRARYTASGIEHLFEPEYHGNPIGDGSALVTFHFGQDFPEIIRSWLPGHVVQVFGSPVPEAGILGDFLEVVLVTKPGGGA